MRQTASFPLDDLVFWKKQLLLWSASAEWGMYLDSHGHQGKTSDQDRALTTHAFECLAAAGITSIVEANAGSAFESLQQWQNDRPDAQGDWLFGFFGYDLKNELERLSSQNPDGVGLPDLGFFCPMTVAFIRNGFMEIQTLEPDPKSVFEQIKNAQKQKPYASAVNKPVQLQPRISKLDYLRTVEAIRQHIIGGDVYELNFCQEFFATGAEIDPLLVFERLNQIGKAPFSTFMRWKDRYLLSASPERFLKKEGRKLISQPIKGTRRRGKSAAEDEKIRQELASSEKDRAENVMIVDLVRNDLSRNCLPGTVQVDELCGIYSFETVHQMISTISGELPERYSSLGASAKGLNNPEEKNDAMTNDPESSGTNNDTTIALRALRDAFPMGSMTGAPKVMAMELIEHFEQSRRGLYSGAVGYFAPNGDFDFNVIIRSILYNAADSYISAQVGGAIVYDSVPEEEYEECLVKAGAMIRALAMQDN